MAAKANRSTNGPLDVSAIRPAPPRPKHSFVRASRRLRATFTDTSEVERFMAEFGELLQELGAPEARREEVCEAVRGLAKNAVRYAGAGSANVRTSSSGLRVEIWDNGPGIPLDRLNTYLAATHGGLAKAKAAAYDLDVLTMPGSTQVLATFAV